MQKQRMCILGAIYILLINYSISEEFNGGAYINLNLGGANQQFLPSGSFAGSLNVGYGFNRYFAMEGGYITLIGSQFGSTYYNNIFDTAVKGTIPLSSILSLYGRLGLGISYSGWSGTADLGTPDWYCSQTSNTNFIGLAGVGGSFRLSPHFELHLEDTLVAPIGSSNAISGQANFIFAGTQFNF